MPRSPLSASSVSFIRPPPVTARRLDEGRARSGQGGTCRPGPPRAEGVRQAHGAGRYRTPPSWTTTAPTTTGVPAPPAFPRSARYHLPIPPPLDDLGAGARPARVGRAPAPRSSTWGFPSAPPSSERRPGGLGVRRRFLDRSAVQQRG